MKKAFIITAIFMQLAVNGVVLDAEKIPSMLNAGGVLNVPDSTTVISGRAYRGALGQGPFRDRGNVVGVEFGVNSRLKEIGQFAFATCALKSIHIPSSVETLGNNCFWWCKSLESAYFGRNSRLSVIENGVFNGCSSLKDIHIPSNVTTLGDCCFIDCTSLKSVIFGGNSHITRIGEYTFRNCPNLKVMYIPSSVTTLRHCCFEYCFGLEFVHFGENPQISIINDSAFLYCSSIKVLNFGLTPAKANHFAAVDLSVDNPELEPTDIPGEVEKFYKGRSRYSIAINPKSMFVPTGMKFSYDSRDNIRVDNSTLGDGFVMVRRDQGELKAFRIRD